MYNGGDLMAGLSSILARAGLATGAIGNLSGFNGSSGYSSAEDYSHANGFSDQNSWSYGQSASSAYTNMDAWSRANNFSDSWEEGQNWSRSHGETGGYSNTDAYGENGGRTYGREASAQDILNAAEANRIQQDLWSMQAEYNAEQARISRDWQQQMSDTYYQRLVDDLKKAGLNPILALNGYGASLPGGATANTGLASAYKANAYAESENYGYNKSTGRSENWGYNDSESYGYNKGGSHGEGSSSSQQTSRSRSSSSSSDRSESSGHSENKSDSYGTSASQTTNNIREIASKTADVGKKAVGALKDIYDNATSGKKAYSR